MHKNLRSFIEALRREDEIVEVEAEVDPYLEIAEIRSVVPRGGAILLENPGSCFDSSSDSWQTACLWAVAPIGRRDRDGTPIPC